MHKLTLKRVVHGLVWRFLHSKHRILSDLLLLTAMIATERRFVSAENGRSHKLPGELIVSLTSYLPRFETLLPTLKCLLRQSIRADRIILWVSEGSLNDLPAQILSLQSKGLEIQECKDIGPYKKIIPALKMFPDAFIVTADDDAYYCKNWLENLIKNWSGSNNQIVCHRAHRIKLGDNGLPEPYKKWDFDIEGPLQSTDIFPTGVGGILYPPGCFTREVMDEEKFMALSPKADDIWLYWMGRRAGAVYQKTPGRVPHILWPNSQKMALAHGNLIENENDKKINTMIEHYGWPV